MANTTVAISGLVALTSPSSGDLLPIVDVLDTTQAASGSTKRITVANLLSEYLTSATAASTYLPLTGGTIEGSVNSTGRIQSSRVLIESTDFNPWNGGGDSDGADAVIAAVSGNTAGGSVSQAGSSLVLQAGIGTGSGANGDIVFKGAADITNQGGNARHSAPTVYGRITMGGVFTIGSISASGQITAGSFSGPLTGNVTGNATTATTASNSSSLGGVAASGYAQLSGASFTGAVHAPAYYIG